MLLLQLFTGINSAVKIESCEVPNVCKSTIIEIDVSRINYDNISFEELYPGIYSKVGGPLPSQLLA